MHSEIVIISYELVDGTVFYLSFPIQNPHINYIHFAHCHILGIMIQTSVALDTKELRNNYSSYHILKLAKNSF